MDKFSFLNAAHIGFIADLYDQYLLNPDAIEPSWRSFFQGYDLANEQYSFKDYEPSLKNQEATIEIPQEVKKEFLVVDLINGYRTRGHLFTKTNPVRERRQYHPSLAIETFGSLEALFELTTSTSFCSVSLPTPLALTIILKLSSTNLVVDMVIINFLVNLQR